MRTRGFAYFRLGTTATEGIPASSRAIRHYLQVTDEHFARATAGDVLQNPMQQAAAPGCNESHEDGDAERQSVFCGAAHDNATRCDETGSHQMGDTGLEPVTSRV